MDLKLLLPQAQTTIKFDRFLVQLPTFKQVWGRLPRVFFERLRIDSPGSSVTVGVCLPVSWHEPHETHKSLVYIRGICQGSDIQCRNLREF
jgi:hypothetical protein